MMTSGIVAVMREAKDNNEGHRGGDKVDGDGHLLQRRRCHKRDHGSHNDNEHRGGDAVDGEVHPLSRCCCHCERDHSGHNDDDGRRVGGEVDRKGLPIFAMK